MLLRLLKTSRGAALPLASNLLQGLQSNAQAMTRLSFQVLAASSICWAAVALAGPPVTIAFKNRNAAADASYKVPQWNKTAKGSGGAVCTATITSTNLGSHAWSVDFVMQ